MKRTQLQHVLRAAASIVELSDLVVIGSQAILASYPEWELPPGATMSVEADLAVDATLARVDLAVDESTLADRIDGAIGEGSMFHQTHGYYAQGVETTTAVLTEGWRDRLIPFVCEDADPKVVPLGVLTRHRPAQRGLAVFNPRTRALSIMRSS
jgi:hypothetical protein